MSKTVCLRAIVGFLFLGALLINSACASLVHDKAVDARDPRESLRAVAEEIRSALSDLDNPVMHPKGWYSETFVGWMPPVAPGVKREVFREAGPDPFFQGRVERDFDRAGRLIAWRRWDITNDFNRSFQMQRRADGLIESIDYLDEAGQPIGEVERYVYDDQSRLLSYRWIGANGVAFVEVEFQYLPGKAPFQTASIVLLEDEYGFLGPTGNVRHAYSIRFDESGQRGVVSERFDEDPEIQFGEVRRKDSGSVLEYWVGRERDAQPQWFETRDTDGRLVRWQEFDATGVMYQCSSLIYADDGTPVSVSNVHFWGQGLSRFTTTQWDTQGHLIRKLKSGSGPQGCALEELRYQYELSESQNLSFARGFKRMNGAATEKQLATIEREVEFY